MTRTKRRPVSGLAAVFKMPDTIPVQPEHYHGNGYSTAMMKLGGKSQRTKDIRSATPRGFAKAVYLANGEKQ
jgi:hypothetical protein